MSGKIYSKILVDRIHKVTEGLINDEQGGFRAEKECVDQILTLKQIGERARKKKMWSICGIYEPGKVI